MHLENQRAHRATAGLFRRAGGSDHIEDRLRQARQIAPNPPKKVPIQLTGYKVFKRCGLVRLEFAAPVVDRWIDRPEPDFLGCL